jgi:MTH538 TIR-like domain (DUF1863)
MGTKYDAFLSYSHAQDKHLASALQSILQKLGKAWYQRRILRVFRDDTSLSATPHLWPSIQEALDQSRFLVLVASREAAQSQWVSKELGHWISSKSADTILVATTSGTLSWDAAADDFAWGPDCPLPPILKGAFDLRSSPNGSISANTGTARMRAIRHSCLCAPTSPPPFKESRRKISFPTSCDSSVELSCSRGRRRHFFSFSG